MFNDVSSELGFSSFKDQVGISYTLDDFRYCFNLLQSTIFEFQKIFLKCQAKFYGFLLADNKVCIFYHKLHSPYLHLKAQHFSSSTNNSE